MGQLSLASAPGDGTTLVCRLTPGGRIDVQPGSPENGPDLSAKAARQIIEVFSAGPGNGVLHLGAAELSTDLPPSLSYWRDGASAAFVGDEGTGRGGRHGPGILSHL